MDIHADLEGEDTLILREPISGVGHRIKHTTPILEACRRLAANGIEGMLRAYRSGRPSMSMPIEWGATHVISGDRFVKLKGAVA